MSALTTNDTYTPGKAGNAMSKAGIVSEISELLLQLSEQDIISLFAAFDGPLPRPEP